MPCGIDCISGGMRYFEIGIFKFNAHKRWCDGEVVAFTDISMYTTTYLLTRGYNHTSSTNLQNYHPFSM